MLYTYPIIFYISIHFNPNFLFPIVILVVYLFLFLESLNINKYFGDFLFSAVFINFLCFLNSVYFSIYLSFLLFTKIELNLRFCAIFHLNAIKKCFAQNNF